MAKQSCNSESWAYGIWCIPDGKFALHTQLLSCPKAFMFVDLGHTLAVKLKILLFFYHSQPLVSLRRFYRKDFAKTIKPLCAKSEFSSLGCSKQSLFNHPWSISWSHNISWNTEDYIQQGWAILSLEPNCSCHLRNICCPAFIGIPTLANVLEMVWPTVNMIKDGHFGISN